MSNTQTTTKVKTSTSTSTPSPSSFSVPSNYGPSQLDIGRGKGFPSIFQSNPNMKQFTWEEVAQHNTESSAWVYIGNQVYDITPWLNRHPGGKEILLLSAGRDISDLFVTYHPFTDKATNIIAKYQIGELSTTEFPQFVPDRGFYQECRQAAGEYFKKNKIDHKNPTSGLLRLSLFLFVAFSMYAILNQGEQWSWSVRIVAAILFGVCQALPLLHTMHDASHLAIGSTPTCWSILGRLCMDWFAGASIYSWFNQHTIGHHVYTNIMGADPDVPMVVQGDVRRITPFQKFSSIYRFQHIYLMVLYGVLGLKFRIQDITDTIVDQTNGAIRVNPQSSTQLFLQFLSKMFWITWRIIIPLYIFQLPSCHFWVTFFITELVTGYYLAFNFQVSHVSPEAIWPDIQVPLSDEWAINQMRTSIDYGHGSFIQTFLSGALNYQSIHHLFPSVSQYHYPALAPLVQKICLKYGVRYNILNNFNDAFWAHVKHLQIMGEQGQAAHVHTM